MKTYCAAFKLKNGGDLSIIMEHDDDFHYFRNSPAVLHCVYKMRRRVYFVHGTI